MIKQHPCLPFITLSSSLLGCFIHRTKNTILHGTIHKRTQHFWKINIEEKLKVKISLSTKRIPKYPSETVF